MKIFTLPFLLLLATLTTHAQKPKDGTYTYKIAFEEWQGKSLNATCTVIIKGDSIKIIYDSTGNITARKGDIIEEGMIMLHKTGKWIVGHNADDKEANDIGGCSSGPLVIDFRKKLVWLC